MCQSPSTSPVFASNPLPKSIFHLLISAPPQLYIPPSTINSSHHHLICSLVPFNTSKIAKHYSGTNKEKLRWAERMSGVWVFKNNGVMQLVENPAEQGGTSLRKKILVHLPSGQVVSSYSFLEQVLKDLGWVRYYCGDPDLLQFHKYSKIDLISLPRDFARFNSVYMYDIVVKNPKIFHVRDM